MCTCSVHEKSADWLKLKILIGLVCQWLYFLFFELATLFTLTLLFYYQKKTYNFAFINSQLRRKN